jgi:hypothetical protein
MVRYAENLDARFHGGMDHVLGRRDGFRERDDAEIGETGMAGVAMKVGPGF